MKQLIWFFILFMFLLSSCQKDIIETPKNNSYKESVIKVYTTKGLLIEGRIQHSDKIWIVQNRLRVTNNSRCTFWANNETSFGDKVDRFEITFTFLRTCQ